MNQGVLNLRAIRYVNRLALIDQGAASASTIALWSEEELFTRWIVKERARRSAKEVVKLVKEN
jgi:hypothetical protein